MAEKSKALTTNEITELVNNINPNDSDFEIEDEEDNDEDIIVPRPPTPVIDESSSDSEDESLTLAEIQRRAVIWRHKNVFQSPLTFENVSSPELSEVKDPFEYFSKYLRPSFFDEMAHFTNLKHVSLTGKSLNCTGREIRKFWGVSIVAALLGFPRLRMCWESRTRYPLVAENMARDRFYLLRRSIKVVDDNAVPQDQKQDSFWKVRPMLNSIRDACLQHRRTKNVSIDEQMIPFHGHVRMRQYIKGKPHPVGLKNFVLSTPSGLPLDFMMYEGKGKEISSEKSTVPEKLDVGGRVVLKLADSLPPGSSIFIDRYFTSVELLDCLILRNISGTGTIMASRVPKKVQFKSDTDMKKEGRGSYDQVVRNDDKLALLKWFDNRAIFLASTEFGVEPVEDCKRWSKKDKAYIQIPRPATVKMYNSYMGGVDLLDRVLGKYAMRGRTKKWTIRVIHHFFDFAIAAAWLEYRQAAMESGWAKKDILSYFLFRFEVAEKLIYFDGKNVAIHDELDEQEDEEEKEDEDSDESSRRKRPRTPKALPPRAARLDQALHLPQMMNKEQTNRSKCRAPGCKSLTFVRCTECKMFLCFTTERNCFSEFHKK
ncbi:piggyBac transposable element-derived protein 3-like [Periplaneta americana]